MRIILVLLLMLAPSNLRAQLHIDKIQVDELQSRLMVIGNFVTAEEPHLFCDSVELNPIRITQDTFIAEIKNTDRGSCGPVWVEAGTTLSNTRILTFWHYNHYYDYHRGYTDGGAEFIGVFDTIHLRFDYSSIISGGVARAILPTQQSRFYKWADGWDGRFYRYTGSKYNYWGMPDSQYVGAKTIHDRTSLKQILLSDNLEVVAYDYDDFCENQGGGKCEHGGPIAPVQFVPSTSDVRSNDLTTELGQINVVHVNLCIRLDYCIYDCDGRQVATGQLEPGTCHIDLREFVGNGLYQFRLPSELLTFKVLVCH